MPKPKPKQPKKAKPPNVLVVPLYELGPNRFAGLRMEMLSMGDVGAVATGTGLGSEAIWLEWKGKYFYVRGAELLKALVRQIDADACERFPEGIAEAVP